MLTFINGDPGDGKTALATAFGIGNMVGEKAIAAVNECQFIIRSNELNTTGYPYLEAPTDHLVYADYAIEANVNGSVLANSKEIDGWKIGLKNPDWKTDLLPPRALVILDEVQFYYDNKRKAELPWFVKNYYQIHRHGYYDFIFISQRTNAVDKDIRALGDKFIFITKMKNFYDAFNNVIATKWDCIEFKGTASAEAYSDSKIISADGIPTSYTYYGNIFACYDSHGRFAHHYNGREDAKYTNTASTKVASWNGREIQKYNQTHKYDVPEIFLKQKTKAQEAV